MNSSIDTLTIQLTPSQPNRLKKKWAVLALFLVFFALSENSAIASPFQEGGDPPAAAAKDSDDGAGDQNKGNQVSPFGNLIWFVLPVILILFMFMTGRPNQKEKKKREEFIASLKKNDEVVTAGGIVAKVVSVKHNPNTVKLMLDEKSGATMTVTHAAISRTFKDDSEENQEEKKD